MEELYKSLENLLNRELNDLGIGHPYNEDRLSKMKRILYFIKYNEFVTVPAEDLLKLVTRLDYEY